MSATILPLARPRPGLLAPTLALVLILAAMGLAFRDTLGAMIAVWNTESFAHGWIIPPIAAWLIWTRRHDLRRQPVRPFLPALAALLACGLGWLLGRLAGVNTVQQFMLVGMVPSLVALLYGWAFAWAIAFPLLFLLFAVPFGQFLMAPMMELTADFTVAAVRLSGVPIMREGLHFELPTGRWSVVEACSGLRYLLAAVPLACIYAYQSYRSWRTRALFVLTVILVAIVANWVRAYMIVMIGHLSGMTLAVGVDHLIYGWVFFGVVMGLSFWVGSFWQDMPADGAAQAKTAANGSTADTSGRAGAAHAYASPAGAQGSARHPAAMLAAAALGLALTAGWPLVAGSLQAAGEATVSLAPVAELVAQEPVPSGQARYRPMYEGGVGGVFGRLRADPEVGVRVVQYVDQAQHGEMITWGNRVVPAGPEDLEWQIRRQSVLDPSSAGSAFPAAPINEYEVTGPSGRFLVWEWFWVNGRVLNDPRRVKIHTALDLVRGRGDESLAWFLWTPVSPSVEAARQRLAQGAGSLAESAGRAGVR